MGYQPFSRKDPLEMAVASERLLARTPAGRPADRPEAAAGPPAGAHGPGRPPEEGPVVLQTRRPKAQRWGCRGAASQTGLYGTNARETHFRCQAAGSGGSASHCWVCPSRKGPGGAVPRAAAAAAAAARS